MQPQDLNKTQTTNNIKSIDNEKSNKVMHFLEFRWFAFAFSSLIIGTGIVFFLMKEGFNLGIDFKGGIKADVKINATDIDIKKLRQIFTENKINAEISTVGEPAEKNFMISLPVSSSAATEIDNLKSFLEKQFGMDKVSIRGSEIVEPKIGKAFASRSFQLLTIVAILILIYVMFRFDFYYGAGAVLALLHDTLIMLSFTVLFNIPVDITVIAAIMTILGYSINDTIVVFDRIREIASMNKDEDLLLIMNRSITQTLKRTIITSLTTFLVVLALFIWGGSVLHNFALELMIGIFFGTYSSIFIAAPVTYMLRKIFDKKLRKIAAKSSL